MMGAIMLNGDPKLLLMLQFVKNITLKPTGIIVIALEIQKRHTMILNTQKIVGFNFVKPSVVFKNPFEAIPRIIAKNKKI